MFVLSATVGVPMALFYPFSLGIKLAMMVGLAFSLLTFGYGVKKRQTLMGQVLAVIGFFAWSVVGMIGLTTGT